MNKKLSILFFVSLVMHLTNGCKGSTLDNQLSDVINESLSISREQIEFHAGRLAQYLEILKQSDNPKTQQIAADITQSINSLISYTTKESSLENLQHYCQIKATLHASQDSDSLRPLIGLAGLFGPGTAAFLSHKFLHFTLSEFKKNQIKAFAQKHTFASSATFIFGSLITWLLVSCNEKNSPILTASAGSTAILAYLAATVLLFADSSDCNNSCEEFIL